MDFKKSKILRIIGFLLIFGGIWFIYYMYGLDCYDMNCLGVGLVMLFVGIPIIILGLLLVIAGILYDIFWGAKKDPRKARSARRNTGIFILFVIFLFVVSAIVYLREITLLP